LPIPKYCGLRRVEWRKFLVGNGWRGVGFWNTAALNVETQRVRRSDRDVARLLQLLGDDDW